MRLAVVTGGSRGLGAALCEHYSAAGWRVVEFSRTAPREYSVKLDLADPQRATHTFDQAFGSLAASKPTEVVAFSNAATIDPAGPVERVRPEEIVRHISANLTSAILFARAFVAAFQKTDCPKTLVNISSGAARHGIAGWSLYCATKAAVDNYMRSVAAEQADRSHPIRAIAVNPGVMDTQMQAQVRGTSLDLFPSVDRYIRLKQEGSLADPAAVAGQIAEIVASRPDPGTVYQV